VGVRSLRGGRPLPNPSPLGEGLLRRFVRIGGIAGGVLGNIIAPGGSDTLGTILGAAGGAAAGRAIDRNGTRCR